MYVMPAFFDGTLSPAPTCHTLKELHRYNFPRGFSIARYVRVPPFFPSPFVFFMRKHRDRLLKEAAEIKQKLKQTRDKAERTLAESVIEIVLESTTEQAFRNTVATADILEQREVEKHVAFAWALAFYAAAVGPLIDIFRSHVACRRKNLSGLKSTLYVSFENRPASAATRGWRRSARKISDAPLSLISMNVYL